MIYKFQEICNQKAKGTPGTVRHKTEASGYYGYSVSATTGYGISCTKHLRIENVF
jgi:hypothetical protein